MNARGGRVGWWDRAHLATLFALLTLVSPAASATLPNIVLILADDLGIGDVSYQSPASKIRTPHIDRLAEHGRIYLDARVPASVCSPTRYALLTGRYPWRTWLPIGVALPFASSLIEPGRPTLPRWLQELGYTTAAVGKWHLGIDWRGWNGAPAPAGRISRDEFTLNLALPYARGPLDAGFDTFFGVDAPNYPPYAYISGRQILGPTPSVPKPDEVYGRPGLMQSGWDIGQVFPRLTFQALQELRTLAARDAPFFLYLPLTAPHTPIAPSARSAGQSGIGPYGDYVLDIDDLVHRIQLELEHAGKLRDTLLIFTSDNGSPGRYDTDSDPNTIVERTGHRPNGTLRGLKTSPYEGGHRVPLFFHWPGGGLEGTSPRPVSLIDLWPTLADLIGHQLPPAAAPDARSFADDLGFDVQHPNARPEGLAGISSSGVRSLRRDHWKLILNISGPELYDLARDPREARNLAAEVPGLTRRLSDTLQTHW